MDNAIGINISLMVIHLSTKDVLSEACALYHLTSRELRKRNHYLFHFLALVGLVVAALVGGSSPSGGLVSSVGSVSILSCN